MDLQGLSYAVLREGSQRLSSGFPCCFPGLQIKKRTFIWQQQCEQSCCRWQKTMTELETLSKRQPLVILDRVPHGSQAKISRRQQV